MKKQLAKATDLLARSQEQRMKDDAAQAREIAQLRGDLAASQAHAEMQQESLRQLELQTTADAAQVEVKPRVPLPANLPAVESCCGNLSQSCNQRLVPCQGLILLLGVTMRAAIEWRMFAMGVLEGPWHLLRSDLVVSFFWLICFGNNERDSSVMFVNRFPSGFCQLS